MTTKDLLEEEQEDIFPVLDEEWFDELEREQEDEAMWHKLETRLRQNDWEDNYFDERYFE